MRLRHSPAKRIHSRQISFSIQILPQAWIRSDIIVTGAIADALLYRPKQNTYYDPATAVTIAGGKEAQFKADLLEMENADEGLDSRQSNGTSTTKLT